MYYVLCTMITTIVLWYYETMSTMVCYYGTMATMKYYGKSTIKVHKDIFLYYYGYSTINRIIFNNCIYTINTILLAETLCYITMYYVLCLYKHISTIEILYL